MLITDPACGDYPFEEAHLSRYCQVPRINFIEYYQESSDSTKGKTFHSDADTNGKKPNRFRLIYNFDVCQRRSAYIKLKQSFRSPLVVHPRSPCSHLCTSHPKSKMRKLFLTIALLLTLVSYCFALPAEGLAIRTHHHK